MTLTFTIPSWRAGKAFWSYAAATVVFVSGYALYLWAASVEMGGPGWDALGGLTFMGTLWTAGHAGLHLLLAQTWVRDEDRPSTP